jgi:hypothetical protein
MDKALKQFAPTAIKQLPLVIIQENIAVANVLKMDEKNILNVLYVGWSFGTKRKLLFVQEVVVLNQDRRLCLVKNSHQNTEKKLVMRLGVKKIGIGKVVLHLTKNKNGESLNMLHGVKRFSREMTIPVKYVSKKVECCKQIILKAGSNIQSYGQNYRMGEHYV